jgi:hypothetical protein
MFVDPCIILQFLQWKSNKVQQYIKILLFFILNEAQHVLGDTPLIIRSLKLHKQPLVLHTLKVGGRAVVESCQVAYERVQCPLSYATWQSSTTTRPTTFHVCNTRGCLCSFRLLMMGGVSPKTCWALFKIRNSESFDTLSHLVGFSLKSCINCLLGTIYLHYYCWSKSRTFTRPWIYLDKLIIKIWIVPTTNLLLLSWNFAGYSRNFLRFVGAKVNCRV